MAPGDPQLRPEGLDRKRGAGLATGIDREKEIQVGVCVCVSKSGRPQKAGSLQAPHPSQTLSLADLIGKTFQTKGRKESDSHTESHAPKKMR